MSGPAEAIRLLATEVQEECHAGLSFARSADLVLTHCHDERTVEETLLQLVRYIEVATRAAMSKAEAIERGALQAPA